MPPLLLGSHMSVAGGTHTAFARGERIGCTTMQVFVKNASRWEARAQTEDEISLYRTAAAASPIRPVVAHAAYLINLCAPDPGVLTRSRRAFLDELHRCQNLGIAALIFHPGAHMGAGEQEGIRRIADSLNEIHHRTRHFTTRTTLECTAGQGSTIGHQFEHLRAIIDLVEEQNRMGVCLDTCHLYAAGYDIGNERGWENTFAEFEEAVGFNRLVAVHVNDSKRELGSRVDRHDHIGKGKIGLEGFRLLMNDPRFASVPKILETEKSEDMHEDVENMRVLTGLLREDAGSAST